MQFINDKLTPEELGVALKQAFRERGITQEAIAINAGVDQSQISRIFNGNFRRIDGGNVKKLCKYANIAIAKSSRRLPDPRKSKLLMSALVKIWDGSPKKERALAELIRSIEPLVRNDNDA